MAHCGIFLLGHYWLDLMALYMAHNISVRCWYLWHTFMHYIYSHTTICTNFQKGFLLVGYMSSMRWQLCPNIGNAKPLQIYYDIIAQGDTQDVCIFDKLTGWLLSNLLNLVNYKVYWEKKEICSNLSGAKRKEKIHDIWKSISINPRPYIVLILIQNLDSRCI